MDKPSKGQESDSSSVGFAEVPGEPAIVINGVPKLAPTDGACTSSGTSDSEVAINPCFGRFLEGRVVRKQFGENYFSGKVVKYDEESKWYRVVYEDEDFEDLDWHELQEVLVPLDIALPLKALLKMNKNENPEENALGSRKMNAKNVPLMMPVEADYAASVPKRGRGRPRRESMEGIEGKQMRGRPRKIKVGGTLGKRRRGRPRKQNAGIEERQGSGGPINQNMDRTNEGKRRRGRPRKYNIAGTVESHMAGITGGAENQRGMNNAPDINLIDIEVGLVNDQGFQQRAEDGEPNLTA